MKLGKLRNVDLREIWKTEASDFTPWLALDENIELLGEAIGIELEVEGTEKDVGPFRADILCKDTVNGHWVLIENQLEKTDHTHLGQLLTYAAGLNAVTIAWIAERFTDEHRATLDWLNEITDDRFNFFGIEIELWKIEDSAVAPNFKIVSKPNDWTKSVSRGAANVYLENLTDAKKLQLEYWTAFREFLLENSKIMRPQKALPQHWTNFAIGRSYFHLSAFVNTRDNRISVALILTGPNAKAHFFLLNEEKKEIETVVGTQLDWEEKPGQKEKMIILRHSWDPKERVLWPDQHSWLKEKLELFHSVFSPMVKKIDASDYLPDG
ncbi:MAG: DUF4268 domain-containing protein [Burkholderiales bacterium]|nr:DUF4268 domain-containing protein [Nitrosomonas sp.]MCP5275078.1 DUF4268 domain-containing protein [Burkholderiales bacterium]